MAKINSVSLAYFPKEIYVGDDQSDITVVTEIEFHRLDIKLEMEYLLHLFVYDIHGTVDTPVIIGNWDESKVITVTDRWKDDFLGTTNVPVKAVNDVVITIETPMVLHLGKLIATSSHHSKKLEIFATIIPAIGRASKWSKPFEADIIF